MPRRPLLHEVLIYALGGDAPDGFVDHLVRHRARWDEVFRRRLDEFAYEFRPDLAIWEIRARDDGRLTERREALLPRLIDDA